MAFSRRTIARLAEGLSEAFSHAGLDTLFCEYDVRGKDPGAGSTKVKRGLALLSTIEASLPRAETDRVFLDLANRVLQNPYRRQNLGGLVASLAVDGLEWGQNRLVPSDPGAAFLAPEITALEQELGELGLNVATTHYRQAVDNFTDGNFEACNGQLRSYLEDLIKGAARRHGQQQAAGPQAALDYLRDGGILDNEEWAVFRALWRAAQDNGPHAGLTDAEEARFRLHTATAAGRYLLKKAR